MKVLMIFLLVLVTVLIALSARAIAMYAYCVFNRKNR